MHEGIAYSNMTVILICIHCILLKNEDLKFEVGFAHTIFGRLKRKSLFVFRILDVLEIALGQSETLLHCCHVRIFNKKLDEGYILFCFPLYYVFHYQFSECFFLLSPMYRLPYLPSM